MQVHNGGPLGVQNVGPYWESKMGAYIGGPY
jgi:hypothetical protein